MKEHKYAEIQGEGAIRRIALSNRLNASIATVWEAVTNIEQIPHWWPDWQPGGLIEKREGGVIRLGNGSWIDGIVKVWRPPHIFEFTWRERVDGTPEWFETNTSSMLRIDLVALAESQTQLSLVQFAPQGTVVGGTAGWHYFAGERLKSFLESGLIKETPGRFEELVRLYST